MLAGQKLENLNKQDDLACSSYMVISDTAPHTQKGVCKQTVSTILFLDTKDYKPNTNSQFCLHLQKAGQKTADNMDKQLN